VNTDIEKVRTPKFFLFHQNNSGGSWDFDEKAGISVNVIVEAYDGKHANERAENIGLYFGGAGDCSCCGDRWSSLYDSEDGDDVPTVYEEVGPGTLYPAKDSRDGWVPSKWMKEGVPEGFIHYLDGRIESFHTFTAQRADLDGTFGYTITFNRFHTSGVKMVGKNGWSEDGNTKAPSHGDTAIVTVSNTAYGSSGAAWFPTKQEAEDFEHDYLRATGALKKALDAFINTSIKDNVTNTKVRKALKVWTS
jgi:hypothetical protein